MSNNLGIMDAQIIDGLESKFNSLVGDLDERGRRRWAASEAIALGYGGISAVSLATGLSDHTIRKGIRELESNHQRCPIFSDFSANTLHRVSSA